MKSPKEDASIKGDSSVIIEKKKKTKNQGNLTLSDISVIGEARKDKSEIISFFFDLFDDESDEVDFPSKEPLKVKPEKKVSKKDLKEKKEQKKTIKPTKIRKRELQKKQKDKRKKSYL